MKKTLLATVAALGLFAVGATFASMNPAARPDVSIATVSTVHSQAVHYA
jgi:hypothetical protein